MEHSRFPVRMSKILHQVDDATSRSSAAGIAALALVVSYMLLAIFGFPGSAEELFSVVASSITVIMMFVLQHTQSRLQTATQLKLDELIRTSPHADDLLVHIESAADTELIERESDQISLHSSLRE
jgi:low affinity Fe/Cu permease